VVDEKAKARRKEALRRMLRVLEPWRRYVRPVFVGLDRVPSTRPLLFVGNHTLYGVLDAPLFFAELLERHDLLLRSLGDHLHFRIPGWRWLLEQFGVVDGTPENAARLLARGEPVLVFPGGGREVAKRKGERYRLLWKNRMGFARLAIAHRATILPFAAVGAEDTYDILFDADDLGRSPVAPLLHRLGVREEVWLPISRGWGGTPFPRRERFYFQVGSPIDTARFGGDASEGNAQALRDETRGAVEEALAGLLALRARDPERYPGRREP
jgi:1-acyl-sn-glycerol-3-phosphate acyltransferase